MPPSDKIWIDPTSFLNGDCPIIILVNDFRGFLGWGIKSRTNDNYCHAETLAKSNVIASQNLFFHEIPLSDYMKPGLMLKFWRIKDLTTDEKAAILAAIQKRLALPAYRRFYDFIGTFVGQFTGFKSIRSPWQEFCSKEVYDDYIAPIPRVSLLVSSIPSPADLDTAFNAHPQAFECLGYYWQD